MRRMKGRHKLLIIFLLLFFTTTISYSQNMLQQKPNKELEEVAREITEMWTTELALSTKQAELMEDKIIEFTMKKNEIIQSKMREEAKTEKLKALQVQEQRDMRNILTKPQFDKYLEILTERIQQQKKTGNP